jgi:3-hydroxyacyl-CoA dehydrogenase/enoyl-CoA hydratase/carnithine racemase
MRTDFKAIRVEVRDGIVVLTLDNPPVNQLSDHFVRELAEAITEAFRDPSVAAVVMTGTGRNFIAGADITQIKDIRDRQTILTLLDENNRFLKNIETGPKPVIAAINGSCLGGGLEVAMACHYRVAAAGVELGQPEVQIGLIPGAGGTQRLPRLIGLPNAVDMLTTGKPIPAEKALQRTLVDEVTEPARLVDAGIAAARRFLSGRMNLKLRATRYRIDRLPSAAEKKALLDFTRLMTAEKGKGYIAPFKAIEAFEKGLGYDIDADLKTEAGLFADCLLSDVARNLIGIFLNTRAAGRLPRIEGIQPAPMRKVAMLGGGVMGSGIVHLLLAGGVEAMLWDINPAAVEKGVGSVRATFDYHLKNRKITPEALETMFAERLRTTTALADLAEADLVIEAVLEDMRVKQDLWKQLERVCRPGAIFATNTSALPITDMAAVLQDPGRMIGMHFFNPAQRMQLLEIICGRRTSHATLAAAVAFARRVKKIPIVVNDGPGFYVSRQLIALMGSSIFLLADGVDSAAIEAAITGFGMPMGPAAISDLTGIDINYHVNRTFAERLGERWAVHPLFEAIYRTGCYGRKTGSGYLDYSVNPPVPNPKVVAVVRGYLEARRVAPKTMPAEAIVEIMMAAAINEAGYMLQEGICDRPQDMDLAMIYGTGFPPYRGGILRYADRWGLKNVQTRLAQLAARYGTRFTPAPLIADMAAEGRTFYNET